MPDQVPYTAYADLDFSHCRKAPQGSVHHFSTVGGHGSSERLRARTLGLRPPTPKPARSDNNVVVRSPPSAPSSNERKLLTAINARNLEALRAALAEPGGIPAARLKAARDLRATLRHEARQQQLELYCVHTSRAATPYSFLWP